MLKEYQTVTDISGPLLLVEQVDGAKYGHIVEIELGDGSVRHGNILQVERDLRICWVASSADWVSRGMTGRR